MDLLERAVNEFLLDKNISQISLQKYVNFTSRLREERQIFIRKLSEKNYLRPIRALMRLSVIKIKEKFMLIVFFCQRSRSKAENDLENSSLKFFENQ